MTEIGDLGDYSVSWQRHMKADGKSPQTIKLYRMALDQLVAVTGSKNVADFTRDDIRHWLSVRSDEVKSATLSQEFRAIRVFWNWLVEEGVIPVSPMVRVKQPKVYSVPVPVYKEGEVEALLATCDRTFNGIRDAALILTLYDTGVRRDEIVNMLLADVDLDKGGILLRITKSHDHRIVPLSGKTVKAIERYIRERKYHNYATDEWLWLGQKGQLTGSGLHQMLKRRGKQAGIEGVRSHRFRHTFAHEASLAGMSTGDLMTIAGWKSPAMTLVYGKSAAVERAFASHKKYSPVDKLKETT